MKKIVEIFKVVYAFITVIAFGAFVPGLVMGSLVMYATDTHHPNLLITQIFSCILVCLIVALVMWLAKPWRVHGNIAAWREFIGEDKM